MRFTHTHHMALLTPNFSRLCAFYRDVLNCPIRGEFPGRNIVFIDVGSTTIELVESADAGSDPATGRWAHLAFEVADVDGTYAELSALGVPFHVLPKDFPENAPSVRIAFFRDPDGNVLELVQPLRSRYPEQR